MTTEIFNLVSRIDHDSLGSCVSRREMFEQAAKFSGKLALAAVPPILAAGCATIGGIVAPQTGLALGVLQFALLLEHLEHDFYVEALRTPNLIPASDRAVFEQISKHEGAHVTFLATGITGIGGYPDSAPQFDFTAGGRYPNVFRDYSSFLEVAQMLEENGVKAYKGQAGNLITSNSLLTVALRIHSVEARHAAEIRRIRGEKAWTGAFDEPATKAQILSRTRPFVRGPISA